MDRSAMSDRVTIQLEKPHLKKYCKQFSHIENL